jgi:VIT1/CCC1 family predicted Fe2+/Mn2+ transporter
MPYHHLDPEMQQLILKTQKTEISEAMVYKKIAKQTKNPHNKEILLRIAADELRHYQVWKTYTGKDVKPDQRMIWRYTRIARLFGVTFGLKLMEGGESSAILKYQHMSEVLPEAVQIQRDEEQHEFELLHMIDEKSLQYLGSVVLGLNDALVELTGVLAGLTFGFQDTKLVACSGLITGIAAAMSMAGSEYLSTKTDNDQHIKPQKAAFYTGIAYICTVIALITPYFLCSNIYIALGITIGIALGIIALFNFYSSVAQGHAFKKRFLEMVAISL